MQSFIIANSEKEKREEYIDSIMKDNTISPFDISHIYGESSIGIETIRDMQQTLYLSPLKGEKKAIILDNAHNLTIEAQNALLKVLEEPPPHTLFFLSVSSHEVLLPTILSRCSLVVLDEEKIVLNADQIQGLEENATVLFSETVVDKLALAEKIASEKETMISWIKNMVVYLREKMLQNDNMPQVAKIIKNLQEAYRILSTTNTQPRITLEHAFLAINQ